MMSLQLSDEEQKLLLEELESTISALRMEVRSTDKKEFRDKLKHNVTVLLGIVESLRKTPVA